MVIAILRRLFKNRHSYDIDDEEREDSVIFEKPPTTTPRLIKATPLSPLLWRYVFSSGPAHPVDVGSDAEEEEDVVSAHSNTCTSSAGYGSGSGSPRSGDGSWPTTTASGSPDCEESSPEPALLKYTPLTYHNMFSPPATLPPITPYRASFRNHEIRRKVYPALDLQEAEHEVIEESSPSREASPIWDEPDYSPASSTAEHYTPATLAPITPSRTRDEVRSKPSLDLSDKALEELEIMASNVETSAVAEQGIWGEPDYSPASNNALDDSPGPAYAQFSEGLVRHESRKISLRRRPTKPVSGRVRQMVQFFENDTIRHEIPRRLDQVSPDFMRSCPQMDRTPATPQPAHKHSTHSDLIRGVSNSSIRCIRCHSFYSTPNSRRSMT